MGNRNAWTKALAMIGSVLVWLPVLAPLLFGVLRFIQARRLLVDYLMPAELFIMVFVGGALLIWAGIRARARRALLGGALGAALALLVGGQALAVVTGLASGETEPVGLPWAAVVGALILYDAAVIAVGIGGGLLLRDLFRNSNKMRVAGG